MNKNIFRKLKEHYRESKSEDGLKILFATKVIFELIFNLNL